MNAITAAALDIKIIDDINAELRPGQFVTAQLGNPGDVDWAPKAPMLLLFSNVVFFGDVQFTGLYKDKKGEYHIAQFVHKHNRRTYDAHSGDDLPVGVLYCTNAMPWDMEKMDSKYLSADICKTVCDAMRWHKDKIEQLPAIKRYKGDKPID